MLLTTDSVAVVVIDDRIGCEPSGANQEIADTGAQNNGQTDPDIEEHKRQHQNI